jgi:hypothetical protein
MFFCEKHGDITPKRDDKTGIARWSDTIWFVFCDGCRGWLSFTVTPKNEEVPLRAPPEYVPKQEE